MNDSVTWFFSSSSSTKVVHGDDTLVIRVVSSESDQRPPSICVPMSEVGLRR